MSDQHSFSLRRASTEYRDLAGKLRELARACVFPGPGEAYCSLRDHSITEPPTSTAGPTGGCSAIGETTEWMLWVLVGLLTGTMWLPGLKTLLRPEENRNNGRWR